MHSFFFCEENALTCNTKVTFQTTNAVKSSATVTVTAPGVSHDIIVNTDSESIAIIGADAEHYEIFNLSGSHISGMNTAGIYIVKDASGNVKKTIKR